MKSLFTTLAIGAVLGTTLPMAAACAQTTGGGTPMAAPAGAPVAPATPPPPAAKVTTPTKTVTAATGGDWTGKWSGQIIQVGRSKAYVLNITFSGKGGTTSYPDSNCTGTLARTGASGDYVFFTETITQGKFDAVAKTGCLSGSVTMVKAGPSIVMGWVAAHEGKPIIAYGTLNKLQ